MESIKCLTPEQYAHLKKNGFKPKICSECQEIDVILESLSANSQLVKAAPDLYEALEKIRAITPETIIYDIASKALAKADGKE